LPVAEKLAMKQKEEVKKTFSSSVDLRERLRQKREKNIQDSEVLNQNNITHYKFTYS